MLIKNKLPVLFSSWFFLYFRFLAHIERRQFNAVSSVDVHNGNSAVVTCYKFKRRIFVKSNFAVKPLVCLKKGFVQTRRNRISFLFTVLKRQKRLYIWVFICLHFCHIPRKLLFFKEGCPMHTNKIKIDIVLLNKLLVRKMPRVRWIPNVKKWSCFKKYSLYY